MFSGWRQWTKAFQGQAKLGMVLLRYARCLWPKDSKWYKDLEENPTIDRRSGVVMPQPIPAQGGGKVGLPAADGLPTVVWLRKQY